MNKKELKILDALEERFYKVGYYIYKLGFKPYIFIRNGYCIEATNLTLSEAITLIHQARAKRTGEWFHIFNKDGKCVEENDILK